MSQSLPTDLSVDRDLPRVESHLALDGCCVFDFTLFCKVVRDSFICDHPAMQYRRDQVMDLLRNETRAC